MSFRGITRYGGVRSPYLGRPAAKREYVVDYARLDGGLNLWDLDYRMGRNESPEMENLWWCDGVLCCRDGQNACDGVDEDGKKAGPGVGYAASQAAVSSTGWSSSTSGRASTTEIPPRRT